MEFGIQQAGFGEMLAEKGVDSGMGAGVEVSFVEQCFGQVKHGVIGAASGEVDLACLKQEFGGADGSGSFIKKTPGAWLHAATASSRTL